MLKRKLHILFVSLVLGLMSIAGNTAYARCELAPANGKGNPGRCGGPTPRSGSSSSNGAAAAVIGAGAGMLLQGLFDAANRPASDEEISRKIRKEIIDNNNRPPSAKTKAALRAAEADASLDPWSNKAKPLEKQSKNKAADAASKAPKSRNKPEYKDGSACVTFDHSNPIGDFVVNSCSMPITLFWKDSATCRTGCMEWNVRRKASITKLKGQYSFTACQGKNCSPQRF